MCAYFSCTWVLMEGFCAKCETINYKPIKAAQIHLWNGQFSNLEMKEKGNDATKCPANAIILSNKLKHIYIFLSDS